MSEPVIVEAVVDEARPPKVVVGGSAVVVGLTLLMALERSKFLDSDSLGGLTGILGMAGLGEVTMDGLEGLAAVVLVVGGLAVMSEPVILEAVVDEARLPKVVVGGSAVVVGLTLLMALERSKFLDSDSLGGLTGILGMAGLGEVTMDGLEGLAAVVLVVGGLAVMSEPVILEAVVDEARPPKIVVGGSAVVVGLTLLMALERSKFLDSLGGLTGILGMAGLGGEVTMDGLEGLAAVVLVVGGLAVMSEPVIVDAVVDETRPPKVVVGGSAVIVGLALLMTLERSTFLDSLGGLTGILGMAEIGVVTTDGLSLDVNLGGSSTDMDLARIARVVGCVVELSVVLDLEGELVDVELLSVEWL